MACSFIVTSLTQILPNLYFVTSLTQILQNLCVGETAHSPANFFLQSHLALWGRRASHSCCGNEMKSEVEWLLREMPEQQSHWPARDPALPGAIPPLPCLCRAVAHRERGQTDAGSRPCPGLGQAPSLTKSLAWPELTRFQRTKLWRNCDAALCSTEFIVPHLWPLLML